MVCKWFESCPLRRLETEMGTKELIEEYLKKDNIFAVVGASRDPEKYGHRVYKDLKGAGYKVYPINPKASEVLGDKSYSSLGELPEIPDVVDIVVPPKITEKIVEECNKLGIEKVWMQPGSESEESIKYCEEHGIDVLHDVCVMVERVGLE